MSCNIVTERDTDGFCFISEKNKSYIFCDPLYVIMYTEI